MVSESYLSFILYGRKSVCTAQLLNIFLFKCIFLESSKIMRIIVYFGRPYLFADND